MNGCACPCIDALDCMQRRHDVDMKILLGMDLTEDEETERCSCSCHRDEEEE